MLCLEICTNMIPGIYFILYILYSRYTLNAQISKKLSRVDRGYAVLAPGHGETHPNPQKPAVEQKDLGSPSATTQQLHAIPTSNSSSMHSTQEQQPTNRSAARKGKQQQQQQQQQREKVAAARATNSSIPPASKQQPPAARAPAAATKHGLTSKQAATAAAASKQQLPCK